MMKLANILLFILTACMLSFASANDYDEDDEDDNSYPYVKILSARDLSALSAQAADNKQVIMLEISASYCGYCELLEEEILKPMLRSGDYHDSVLIRKIELDGYYDIFDFTGDKTTPEKLVKHYRVPVTPTLLFLDSEGNEVAERILGINSLDFYGGYVDDAIEKALLKIR